MKDNVTKKMKIKALSFDGPFDPKAFNDWLSDMDIILIGMIC